MGGYGAMKIGLSRPDLFASAATLSGALDINEIVKDDVGTGLDFSAIFGDSASLSGSIHDLYHLLGSEPGRAGEDAILPGLRHGGFPL